MSPLRIQSQYEVGIESLYEPQSIFFQSTIGQITLETVSPSCKFGLLNLDGGLFKAHVLLVEVLVMVEVVRKCDVGYVHPMLHDLLLV